MKERKMYKPLPDYLTIKESPIHELGLFATKYIPSGVNLGMSHFITDLGETIRTPLGGMYNHSNDPNCIKDREGVGNYFLVTLKDIHPGEELTVKYTFYEVPEKPKTKIITEEKMIAEELLKDNEKIMKKNQDLSDEIDRLNGLIQTLTFIGQDMIKEKEELRAQVEMLKKGLSLN